MSRPGGSPGGWVLPPRWHLPAPLPDGAPAALAAGLSLPEPLGRVLLARGIDRPDAAKAFLRPLLSQRADPSSLVDLDRAADRIDAAVRSGATILVHGDYDVDGISATALLARWLRRLGGNVTTFIPHRLRDGYGFGEAGISAARAAGAGLIVTVDCGITSNAAVDAATALGIDVVVTDHHQQGAALPAAWAVVNPNRRDCPSGLGHLCGAGVAFKLLERLAELRGIDHDELLPDLDLVALATVADVVPLVGENRMFVRYGLRALERTTKPGLRALLQRAGVDGPPDASDVSFRLAPRLNALGRVADANDALGLLLTDDPVQADALAAQAEQANNDRRAEDDRTREEALAEVAGLDPATTHALVLARDHWHPGVIGIVASRLVQAVHRPVLLVAFDGDRGRGSGRSIPGFDLHDALTTCGHLLEGFGGHPQAAGFTVAAGRLEEFRAAFSDEARRRLEGIDPARDLHIDAEIDVGEVSLELARLFTHLGPHGAGNPRPLLLTRGVRVAGTRVVGGAHLRLDLDADGVVHEAIGFGLAADIDPAALAGRRIDVVHSLGVNEWRGRTRVQLEVRDLRVAGTADPTDPAVRGSGAV